MKSKLLPFIVLVALVAIGWAVSSRRSLETASTQSVTEKNPNTSSDSNTVTAADSNGPMFGGQTKLDGSTSDDDGEQEVEVLPAAKVYKNADEAMAAIRKGAVDYDDSILEQFTEPGEDCTFCPELYKNIKDTITGGALPSEQISFYGELLAVSGRPDNLSALVDAIKSAPNNEVKEALAEALELTVGKDDVTTFLGTQLSDTDTRVKEASIAAITNQGNRKAAELLYKATVEKGDPDGFYSQGTGLGELVPDDDTIPFLQELVSKHDQYSHLAVKSLLNAGLGGLRTAMDTLSLSKDPESDRNMLSQAVDHVSYDEETEAYLTKLSAESKNPVIKEFADKVLQSFKGQAEDDTADGGTGEEEESSDGSQDTESE